MPEIQRRQSFLQRGDGLPDTNVAHPEPRQRDTTHRSLVLEKLHRRRGVVPEVDARVAGIVGTRVAVAQIEIPFPEPFAHDGRQRILLRRRGEDAVCPSHRPHVEVTRPGGVCLRNVDLAAGCETNARRRIVHHRRPVVDARDVVVRHTERMADFVGTHLPYARQDESGVSGRRLGTEQRRVDVVVRPCAMRIHARHALQDLASAGIAERPAH